MAIAPISIYKAVLVAPVPLNALIDTIADEKNNMAKLMIRKLPNES